MIELQRHTLCLIDTLNYGKAICSLRESLKWIKPARVIFFTDIQMDIPDVEIVIIPKLTSKDDYSKWVMCELYKFIQTEFVLITQHDGFCLSDKWDDRFYEYDLIGAKWLYTDGRNAANGGFTSRSKKLMEILGTDPLIDVYEPEDAVTGRLYRRYLEQKHGIKFAPDDICDLFSFELNEPINETLGFHSYFWPPYQETVMLTREAALGDIVALEPLMYYYHKKGYRVVLNTLQQFYNLFVQHYFPVLHPSQLHPKIPYTEKVLDMAYEISPQKLHLEAYYEVANVPKEERIIRNPILSLEFDPTIPANKLYPKYCVIHNDLRNQTKERNIYDLDWKAIADYLKKQGYTIIQIGKGERIIVEGAVQMNTPTEPFLKWVIGGCDLFLGIDSGCANIAVAFGRKAVIFTGSVDLRLIYPDLSNILWITNHFNDVKPCEKEWCWHKVVGGVQGVACIVDDSRPPCCIFNTTDTLSKIETFIKNA